METRLSLHKRSGKHRGGFKRVERQAFARNGAPKVDTNIIQVPCQQHGKLGEHPMSPKHWKKKACQESKEADRHSNGNNVFSFHRSQTDPPHHGVQAQQHKHCQQKHATTTSNIQSNLFLDRSAPSGLGFVKAHGKPPRLLLLPRVVLAYPSGRE